MCVCQTRLLSRLGDCREICFPSQQRPLYKTFTSTSLTFQPTGQRAHEVLIDAVELQSPQSEVVRRFDTDAQESLPPDAASPSPAALPLGLSRGNKPHKASTFTKSVALPGPYVVGLRRYHPIMRLSLLVVGVGTLQKTWAFNDLASNSKPGE